MNARSSIRSAVTAVVVMSLAACTATTAKATSSPSSLSSKALHSSAATSAASTGTPTAVSTAATSAEAAATVTIVGSGDVLIHPPLWEQAAADAHAEGRSGYDFLPMYASIRDVTSAADLATCEMETPLAPPQGPFSGWPNFNAPPQVLTALKAVGYDSCTTASNHSLDQGYDGVKRTLDELDAAGLKHTGSARSAAEASGTLMLHTQAGADVAQLAFAFGFNGIPLPPDKPWLANAIDVPTILAAAHRARQQGADIVVLSLHWGTEYQHEPTAEQSAVAKALLASPDIDVILGDHVHVVQPFEKINGKWVAYGMGNQISRHADPIDDSREGVMPRFTFGKGPDGRWRVVKAEAIPTWMQIKPALRLIELPSALRSAATSSQDRAIFQHAYDQISRYVDSLKATQDGLVITR